MTYAAVLDHLEIPGRIRILPIDDRGFPVPWFVARINGKWDFRVIGPGKVQAAISGRRCWICGGILGRHLAFTVGPMCAINRISAEPPAHLECSIFACRACPFLTNPKMRRNDRDVGAETDEPAGIMIRRNPGVTLSWVTRSYEILGNARQGALFKFGEPESLRWFAQGRAATRAEIMASFESGLPLLRAECERERDEATRERSHAELDRQVVRAMKLIPEAA